MKDKYKHFVGAGSGGVLPDWNYIDGGSGQGSPPPDPDEDGG